MNQNKVKFEGTQINLNGAEYIIPPLTFGQLKRLRGKLNSLRIVKDSPPDVAQLDILQEVILEALQRNYPDLTSAILDDQLDMRNVLPTFLALMGQSGLVANSGEVSAAS